MIKCIIIEDEPLAQRGLLNLIKVMDNIRVLSVCDDVADFVHFQETSSDKPDLLLLDIELPGMSGIDFLKYMPPGVPVILTTAYHQFAVESYELNVLDYLLKPISKERFSQAIQKAEQYLSFMRTKEFEKPDSIYIKSEKIMEKILFSELHYIEAMRNYVIYHCENRRLISYNSLKNTELLLPAGQFIKVQKSFIVNREKVQKIEKGAVFIHGKSIAINRENKQKIIQLLTEV
jgi:DNA-binding LytR/AlgR family response regulator